MDLPDLTLLNHTDKDVIIKTLLSKCIIELNKTKSVSADFMAVIHCIHAYIMLIISASMTDTEELAGYSHADIHQDKRRYRREIVHQCFF